MLNMSFAMTEMPGICLPSTTVLQRYFYGVSPMVSLVLINAFHIDNDEYTTCNGLITKSSSKFPKSSVLEIAASGVSINKIVIGKPVGKTDAPSGGLMTPATIGQCVALAKKSQWSAGIMGFEVCGNPCLR